MIKFISTDSKTNRKTLGIIILKENVKRLKENKPIHFSKEQMGLVELKVDEITIIYFDTYEAAIGWLASRGYVTKRTVIKQDLADKKPS